MVISSISGMEKQGKNRHRLVYCRHQPTVGEYAPVNPICILTNPPRARNIVGLVKPITLQQSEVGCPLPGPTEPAIEYHDPVYPAREIFVRQIHQPEVVVIRKACVFHFEPQERVGEAYCMERRCAGNLEHHSIFSQGVLANRYAKMLNSWGPDKIELRVLTDVREHIGSDVHPVYC